jgi:hypothetical protein
VLEHDLMVFRRGWHSYILSGLSQPFLYLISMGIGLGFYVNRNGGTPAVFRTSTSSPRRCS